MENKEFDKIFQSLGERKITPSDNAFSKLQDALNMEENSTKKKRIMPIWWVAAAIILVLFSTGVWYYMPNNKTVNTNSFVIADQKSEETILEENTKSEPEWVTQHNEEIVIAIENTDKKSEPKGEPNNSENQYASTIPEEKEEVLNEEENQAFNLEKEIEYATVFQDTTETISNEVERSPKEEQQLAELLKPIEDSELDALLHQKKYKKAIAEVDDETIMNLLLEAQTNLRWQEDPYLAGSEVNDLLLQAEMELKYDRSLQGIFQRAIEAGIVEVQTLFGRE